jgi:hypothetical protein
MLPPSKENYINRKAVALGLPVTPIVGDVGFNRNQGEPGENISGIDMWKDMLAQPKELGVPDIPLSSFYIGDRYKSTLPGTDYEEMAASGQTSGERWANGSLKLLGTATTSFISGTVGLVAGIGASIVDQRLASLIDNPVTRKMDDVMQGMEDYAPNYYSHQEQDAKWYSPKNILTANFWSDKVLKNLGYSVGAIGGGVAWGGLFRSIGLTNKLVQAGRGMEAATAIEEAMAGAASTQKLSAFENALGSLSQKYIKSPVSAVLKDSDRILTSTMGTFGEASMEGLQGMNKYRKDAIEEYKAIYGEEPTGAVLDKINASADQVGMYIWGANSLLLTGTNYVQLPKILGSSRKADKALINSIEKDAETGLFKQVVPATKFGRLAQKAKGVGQVLFAPSEAFEEGMQSSVQTGVNNYFERARQNKQDTSEFISTLNGAMQNVFGEGINNTLTTKEGIESILIGGISGGIQQGGIVGTYRNKEGKTRVGIGKSGVIAEQGLFGAGGERQANTDIAVAALNKSNIQKQLKDGVKYLGIGIGSQKLRQDAIANNDVLSEKDYEADFTLSYLMPRIKYGKEDSVKDELDLYKNQAMDPDGFRQLVTGGIANENETRDQFLQRINNLQEFSKSVSTLYDKINDKYENEVNDKGQIKYTDDVIDKLVYSAAKIRDYDARIPGVSNSLVGTGVNTQSFLNALFQKEGSSTEDIKSALATIDELDVTNDEKNDLKKSLYDLAELSLRRKEMIDQYNEILDKPTDFKEPEEPDTVVAEDVEEEVSTETPGQETVAEGVPVVKVKTKDGQRSLEIGTEYFVGKGVDYDKEGLNSPIPISKLTILEENADGTIKIKGDNGEVRDISKKMLENYKLGKVSSLKANKTANFFYNHRNDLYEYNFGKNFGGVKQGRLELQEGKLYFVYLNNEGKVDKKQLFNSHFVVQEGYEKARVTKVGDVRSETAEQQAATEEFTSPEELAKQKETLAKNREARLDILSEIEKDTTARLEEVNKKLLSKVDELTKIQEDLDAIAKLKEEGVKGQKIKGNFSKVLSTSVRTLNRYTAMKNNVDQEIAKLKGEKEELEMNISYFQDFANNLDDLPENTGEFLKELRDQIGWLTDLGKQTGETLSSLEKLSKEITSAIKTAARLLKDSLNKFDTEYPDYIKEAIDSLIESEEPLSILPLLKEYLADYAMTNDIAKDISVSAEKLEDASNQAKEIKANLEELRNEYKAKKIIVDKFQKIFDEYKKQKAQEDKLFADEAVVNKALATSDKGIQAREFNTAYEADAKKSNEIIPRASVAKEEGRPHQVRANKFGAKLNSFPNRNDIRGVYITSKNQNQKLPGVIERMLNDDPTLINKYKDSMIVMVMVNSNGDLVGVDGQPIPAGTELLDAAIYQAYPEGKMRDGSLFRENTSKEVKDSIIAQYETWRKGILAETKIGKLHEIEASFGIVQNVKDAEGNTVYSTRTSVTNSGLVSPAEIERSQLILIPKTNTIVSKGTVSYDSPLGMVFLDMPNGYTKLQNRQHTQADASAIFDSMLQFAKNMIDPEQGTDSDSSKRILRFLQGVTYWGVPTDQQGNRKEKDGYSSVFFEKSEDTGKLTLMIGGRNTEILFTPSALRMNKDSIIDQIGKIYTNTNSAFSKDLNEKFEQIISISPEGEIKSELWDNYQSYLLSDVKPDGSKRSDYELPLSTPAKPLIDNEDVNREGIYFFTTDTADQFVVPVPKKVTPKVLTPAGAPKAVVTDENEFTIPEVAAPVYKLDGVTPNTYTSPQGKKILFTAPSTTTIDNYTTSITVLQGEDLDEVVKTITDGGKDFKEIIKKTIYNAISQELTKLASFQEDELEYTMPDDIIEEAEKETGKSLDQDVIDAINSMIDDGNDEAHRVAIESEVNTFEPENWSDVESWLKSNFPNLPVYRVKNIIQATNGRQAWGMLKDGAIYLYENAEVGTAYHEVFEAVWKMFTDVNEQEAVRNEFISRKGTFVDRPTGKTIKYSEATPEQAKEQLAEEFREYIMNGKIPAKPTDGRPFIVKLFADIVSFIKGFFTGKNAVNNTEELFKKIGNGYYKNNMPYATQLSMAKEGIIDIEDAFANSESEFRLAKVSDREGADIIQHMTYLTLTNLINTDKSLFTRDSIPSSELYSGLKIQILQTINQKNIAGRKLLDDKEYLKDNKEEKTRIIKDRIAKNTAFMQDVSDEWPTLVERHKEYLKGYQIEFDENDNVAINDLEKSKDEGFGDASKIDSFKKANPAIKLLLSTIPIVNPNNPDKLQPSSIGGAILIPTSKTYISLMSNLHTASSIEDMLEKLRVMAENDPNYRTLYRRITKRPYNEEGVDLTKVDTTHGLQLISALWKTFKKQNPDVKNVFILENGDVVVGDASLSNAANQLRSEYINNIVINAKANKGFFTYDDKKKVFIGDQSKIKGVVLDSPTAQSNFLKQLGIQFSAQEILKLKGEQLKTFNDAVSGVRASISQSKEIATFSGKVLDISNRLLEIGLVKATVSNPEFNSTYFNVSGERTQSFIGTNAASDLYTFLSKLEKKSDIAGTKYSYLLTDSFAQGSNLLDRMFGSDGIRKEYTLDLFEIGYVSGTINESNGKQKSSSKLTFPERLTQELNLNLKGWYLNLIPGDASLEWMINMGNPISTTSISRGMADINNVFKGYFLSELALSREEDRPVAKGRNRKDLRFFKSILGKELHDEIISSKDDINTVYALNENKINAALLNYINVETSKYQSYLKRFGILDEGLVGISLKNVNLPKNMSKAELNRQLSALTVNFMINNIEMHKLLYADPYQYDDELKRIKSFNSPRQAIVSDSPKMNAAYDNVWNKGFKKGDIGYTKFTQDYFKTATHEDVIGIIDLPGYEDHKETDGSGIIGMKSNRQFRIRAGEWNENEERQYKYDIAWEKRDKNLKLSPEEEALLTEGNPKVKSAYTPLKPIVSGAKLGADGQPKSINDIVLDKYALYPLSYRVMKELNADSNAVKLYNKMQNENIDYIVFKSARKVGAEAQHATYDKETGEFNNALYEGIINVPFSIMSVQSEVPSKDNALVTRGSQVTKLLTLDYLAAGVPIDFFPGKDFDQRYKAWNNLTDEQKFERSPIFKEVKNNQVLLNEIMEEGFDNLLNTLGIKLVDGEFRIDSLDKAVTTLRNEVLKREVNDNISNALTGFLEGKSVLEATPAGQQIKNILYSIADKEVISPKISGGMKVQIPSTLLESVRAKEGEINGKKGFTSDVLKFYEDKDGKRVCEIMVGRWFKSSKTDQELLDEWYTTDENGNKTLTKEGEKVLSGLAFRIPTQKQNSIDSFVIKQFLPEEFGDSVVVPSALVQKVGSDFDIDKLSIYFKNVYENRQGDIKTVPFLGYGKEAKAKFAELFDQGEFITKDELAKIEEVMLDDKKELTRELTNKLMASIFGNQYGADKAALQDEKETLLERQEFIKDYLRDTTKESFKSKFINKLYKQSLENAYIQSSQNLVSHPSNFSRLIKPNSADQLKKLGNFIAEKTVGQSFDYTDVGNMLDRRFMSRLRHAFVTGKYAIGIAAVNQTNHSLNQRQATYIDDTRLNKLSEEDKFWIGDGKIKFDSKSFNQMTIEGKGLVPSLSMITNADGQDISDILGQFIDGYVDISAGPWIMELGATPNVASTFMFLTKIGVPIDTIAYFMNQPIIYDYLNSIENAGYSWLFIEDFVNNIKDSEKYKLTDAELNAGKIDTIPSKTILKDNVGKQTFNRSERADQHFMLDEFLKYAKMGEQLFLVTQGSNYDTATLNDPLLIWKKDQQLAKAQNTIISSVDDILDNSHIGSIRTKAGEIRQALAQFLKADRSRVRGVIQKVLTPYINLNDRDFLKTAQKVQNDLFDWAVQTNGGFNKDLQAALIDNGGYAKDILDFVNKVKSSVKGDPEFALKDNHVINIIESDPSKKASKNTPNNIKVKGLDNKVYDQNNIIYAFREIREYLKSQNELTGQNNQLYNNLVTLAVLQSGLSNSPISFTSVLPYEDFEKIYNKTLSKLESISNLDDFYNLGVFQRNNWSNDDVVPYKRANWIQSKTSGDWFYNPSMAFLSAPVKEAVATNEIPPVMTQSINSKEANFDFIVYTWEKREDLLTAEEMQDYKDSVTKAGNEGKLAPKLSDVITAKKTEMRKAGDFSFINKGLFQKVKDNYGTPLIDEQKSGDYFVYKAVNAWGDSYRANEFYETDHNSIFDNGFIEVQDVDNNVIIGKFLAKTSKKTVEKKASINEVYDKIDNDSYSLNLQYGTGKYDMVITRNGEVIDPRFYNPSTNKDVDVDPSMFRFSKEDLENIFKQLDQSEDESWKEEDNNDTCTPFL